MNRDRLKSVPVEPRPASTVERLRANIGRRDALTRELAMVDAAIAADARIYADARGEFVRPTIDQLRRRLTEGEA